MAKQQPQIKLSDPPGDYAAHGVSQPNTQTVQDKKQMSKTLNMA